MPSIALISTTVGKAADAHRLAKSVIDAKLAACVQIDGPIESIYHWQGQICMDPEFRLTCKSLSQTTETLIATLMQQHPYQTPEFLISQVEATQEYYDWLAQEVSGASA